MRSEIRAKTFRTLFHALLSPAVASVLVLSTIWLLSGYSGQTEESPAASEIKAPADSEEFLARRERTHQATRRLMLQAREKPRLRRAVVRLLDLRNEKSRELGGAVSEPWFERELALPPDELIEIYYAEDRNAPLPDR